MKRLKFYCFEKYFFYMILCLTVLPLVLNKFFTTRDGPAHLHNSQLIISLTLDKNSYLHSFFKFNEDLVPNWIGHFLLSLFNYFLPGYIVEKIILLIIVIGLIFSYRKLVKTISPNNVLLSYYIFPFSYSFLFFLGFYNFLISLILFFITLHYWIENEERIGHWRRVFELSCLFILTYFSHIFSFGILLLVIIIYSLTKFIFLIFEDYNLNDDSIKKIFLVQVKKLGFLFISSSIPLILSFLYFSKRAHGQQHIYLSSRELVEWIVNVRPVIALHVEIEQAYSKKLFYALYALSILAFYIRINEIVLIKTLSIKNFIKTLKVSDFWLIVSVLFLLLYFKIPDSDGKAGFVSSRLLMFFFLIYIIWLSTHHFPLWVQLVSALIVLYSHFNLILYYSYANKIHSKFAEDIYRTSEYIQEESVVLPFDFSNHWFMSHFSNYLGIDKPMVILENYECFNDYFPLRWNDEKIPNLVLGNVSSQQIPCLRWKTNLNNPKKTIDYVFILGDIDSKTDSCTLQLKNILSKYYFLRYKSENCSLFKSNESLQ